MASVRGILNIQSLNELTYENSRSRCCLTNFFVLFCVHILLVHDSFCCCSVVTVQHFNTVLLLTLNDSSQTPCTRLRKALN
jgi:hypothetical protein